MAAEQPEQDSSPAPETMPPGATEPGEVAELFKKLESGELTHDEQIWLGKVMQAPAVVIRAMRHETFSGPIPPAEHLNQYDESVRRLIVQMAKDEQKHAHTMRERGLQGAINKDRRGQWLGGAIAITGLMVAAIIAPHSAAAAAIIGTLDLFGMVALFVAPRVLDKRRQDGPKS